MSVNPSVRQLCTHCHVNRHCKQYNAVCHALLSHTRENSTALHLFFWLARLDASKMLQSIVLACSQPKLLCVDTSYSKKLKTDKASTAIKEENHSSLFQTRRLQCQSVNFNHSSLFRSSRLQCLTVNFLFSNAVFAKMKSLAHSVLKQERKCC